MFESGCYVIAEAGSNHGGSLTEALALVDAAADAGAHCVKFQFIFPENLYLPFSLAGRPGQSNPVFTQRKREQLSNKDWGKVWDRAEARGISVSASVFCSEGIRLLAELGAEFVKISSSDLTNVDLLLRAGENFEHVILSTGMATLPEVAHSVSMFVTRFPSSTLSLMHCVSLYPCDLSEANVKRIQALKNLFSAHSVGYSDHTLGGESALMALSEGATFFEKHFTLDNGLAGFDHAHALEPKSLADYISLLQKANAMYATNPTQPSQREIETRLRARRGLYASRDLVPGHVLEEEDILHVRPSTSSTSLPSDLLGKTVLEPVSRFAALGLSQIGHVETMASRAEAYWASELEEKGLPSS